jgi:hypothetical protein
MRYAAQAFSSRVCDIGCFRTPHRAIAFVLLRHEGAFLHTGPSFVAAHVP